MADVFSSGQTVPKPEFEDEAFVRECQQRLEEAVKHRELVGQEASRADRLITGLRGALDSVHQFDDQPQQNVESKVGATHAAY